MFENFIDSKRFNRDLERIVEVKSEKLKKTGDYLIMKVFIGQNDFIVKEGIITKIYDKGFYNMILCQFKGRHGDIYYSCMNQLKESLIIY